MALIKCALLIFNAIFALFCHLVSHSVQTKYMDSDQQPDKLYVHLMHQDTLFIMLLVSSAYFGKQPSQRSGLWVFLGVMFWL